MSQHTPGPWYVDIDELMRDDSYAVTTGEYLGGDWIASARPLLDDNGMVRGAEHQANARLIAAAPDLYAALGRTLAAINDLYRERAHDGHCSLWEAKQMYNNDGAVIAARAALRKARGGDDA